MSCCCDGSSAIPREYIDLIKWAAGKVDAPFFKLATTYELAGIVRERVFCYELYHQLRLGMGQSNKLSLNGEIDKRGHFDFAPKDRKNPDFVFHIPGTHSGNTLVIEVKGSLDSPDGIQKDIKTILTFVGKYSYKAGVFVLYNHSFEEFANKVSDNLRELSSEPMANSVFILSIKKPHGDCEEHLLSDVKIVSQ